MLACDVCLISASTSSLCVATPVSSNAVLYRVASHCATKCMYRCSVGLAVAEIVKQRHGSRRVVLVAAQHAGSLLRHGWCFVVHHSHLDAVVVCIYCSTASSNFVGLLQISEISCCEYCGLRLQRCAVGCIGNDHIQHTYPHGDRAVWHAAWQHKECCNTCRSITPISASFCTVLRRACIHLLLHACFPVQMSHCCEECGCCTLLYKYTSWSLYCYSVTHTC